MSMVCHCQGHAIKMSMSISLSSCSQANLHQSWYCVHRSFIVFIGAHSSIIQQLTKILCSKENPLSFTLRVWQFNRFTFDSFHESLSCPGYPGYPGPSPRRTWSTWRSSRRMRRSLAGTFLDMTSEIRPRVLARSSWPPEYAVTPCICPDPWSGIVGGQELEAPVDFLLCSLYPPVRPLVNSCIISDLNSVCCVKQGWKVRSRSRRKRRRSRGRRLEASWRTTSGKAATSTPTTSARRSASSTTSVLRWDAYCSVVKGILCWIFLC